MIPLPRSLNPWQPPEAYAGLVLSPGPLMANLHDERAVRVYVDGVVHLLPRGWDTRDAISGDRELLLCLGPDRYEVRVLVAVDGRINEIFGYGRDIKDAIRRIKFGVGR